ncbi:MAG: lipoyl(octanoyl) transferase LipB [Woeseiaceae bacterium]|jgi:lipoyl(octanoyl) transferase|nr:lipoyl(octanoyl) transferase LipB [Woeseiaceae bacterium]
MKSIFRGRQEYIPLWHEMQEFTNNRNNKTPDRIWFVEHPPVFTMGLNANEKHLLAPGDIPVVQTDRGGQVTFHGPGQLMIYPLIDLRRSNIGVRSLVTSLEQSVIDFANNYNIKAIARRDAPGVYVNNKKLASIGLRVRHGSSFHGMALNVAIDLEPFTRINTCGYTELQVTDLQRLGVNLSLENTADEFLPYLLNNMHFS